MLLCIRSMRNERPGASPRGQEAGARTDSEGGGRRAGDVAIELQQARWRRSGDIVGKGVFDRRLATEVPVDESAAGEAGRARQEPGEIHRASVEGDEPPALERRVGRSPPAASAGPAAGLIRPVRRRGRARPAVRFRKPGSVGLRRRSHHGPRVSSAPRVRHGSRRGRRRRPAGGRKRVRMLPLGADDASYRDHGIDVPETIPEGSAS